jgi:hypothetical protein
MSFAQNSPSDLDARRRDWAWMVGDWRVQHRRLKGRLVGSSEWETFDGTCAMWLTLGGLGNVDDNVLELPDGTYRAMTVRAFDSASGQWSIWWLDGRNPTALDVPVRGGFVDGVGRFEADDVLDGRPIRVRFRWLDTDTASPRWEQAFSADGGETWEVNWVMQFSRAG